MILASEKKDELCRIRVKGEMYPILKDTNILKTNETLQSAGIHIEVYDNVIWCGPLSKEPPEHWWRGDTPEEEAEKIRRADALQKLLEGK